MAILNFGRKPAPRPAQLVPARRKVGRPTREEAAERARAESARLDAEIKLHEKRRQFEQLKATGRAVPVSIAEARALLEESGFEVRPAGAEDSDLAQVLKMFAPIFFGQGPPPAQAQVLSAVPPTVATVPPLPAAAPSPSPQPDARFPAAPADVVQRVAAMQPAPLIGDVIVAGVAGKTATDAATWLLAEPGQADSTGDLIRQLVPKLLQTPPSLLPQMIGVVARMPGWESLAGYVGAHPALLHATVVELRHQMAAQQAHTPSL